MNPCCCTVPARSTCAVCIEQIAPCPFTTCNDYHCYDIDWPGADLSSLLPVGYSFTFDPTIPRTIRVTGPGSWLSECLWTWYSKYDGGAVTGYPLAATMRLVAPSGGSIQLQWPIERSGFPYSFVVGLYETASGNTCSEPGEFTRSSLISTDWPATLTVTSPSDCTVGDGVRLGSTGFQFDGGVIFEGVTDTTTPSVIPTGCVSDGVSTACFDALAAKWDLRRQVPSVVDGVCYDYFGEVMACDSEACWWSGTNYQLCPNSCTVGPMSVCTGGPRGNDQLTAYVVVDASSDPDYVLLIVQLTADWGRAYCCTDGDPGTGTHVIYKMRTYYRVAKSDFTCLCPLCFAKYDEQLITGSEVPCLNLPDHIRVNPVATGATDQQLAEANTRCSSSSYQPNIDCAVPSGCGQAVCSYVAQPVDGVRKWIYQSGICISGCICPDHDALIASGRPLPQYDGQVLTVTTDCVTGDRPCSTILGRCCYTDETGTHCIDDVDECDCGSLYSGCWDVGTGIDCAHLDTGFCTCVTPIGLCCYDDSCTDGVTEAECGTLSSGAGCWIEQNADHSDFSCANDRGGCSSCGTACPCSDSSACGYSSVPGASPTGYVWYLSIGTCSPGCACPTVDDAFNTLHGYPPGDGSGFIFTKCADC